MKKVLWVLLALVLIAGILIWRVIANLDGIVAGIIEDAGSQALGTTVSVDALELKLTEGSATIGGLTVANPDGWEAANAFELDSITVAIDINSLSEAAPLVLRTVNIGESRVAYEMKADGSNNLQDLLSGIESGSGEEAPADSAGQPMLMRIDTLSFAGMDVAVTAESPEAEGGVQEQNIRIPSLQMSQVGGPNGGTPTAIAGAIGKQMTSEILEAAAKEGVNRLIEKEKEKLGERLMDKLKGD